MFVGAYVRHKEDLFACSQGLAGPAGWAQQKQEQLASEAVCKHLLQRVHSSAETNWQPFVTTVVTVAAQHSDCAELRLKYGCRTV